MAYRSENDKFSTKPNYSDLNLTLYPNSVDTRTNNTNMRGFVNIGDGALPDYVMAEYVNAALDAVMALERALGVAPMVPYGTAPAEIASAIETGSVASRLSRIENGLFDIRYGGTGWNGGSASRPTLNTHNHDGLNGHPGKINLQTETEGILQKASLNLTSETGVTGADMFVSKTNPVYIQEALSDTLSLANGGTVKGPVIFEKSFRSRTQMDFVATELTNGSSGSLVTDAQTTVGTGLQSTSTTNAVSLFTIPASMREKLLLGKYILSVRLKTSNTVDAPIVRMNLGGQSEAGVKGSFFTANTYKQIFFMFDQTAENKSLPLIFEKMATGAGVNVTIDNVFIEPAHPAILDR